MIAVVRKYRYVVQDRDRHGNLRVYLRRPGQPKLRLWNDPGTPEFDSEYRQAMAGEIKPKAPTRPPVPRGSLRELCIAYFGSPEVARLDPRSTHVRRLILDKLCDTHGDKPVSLMEPKHVRSIRDARADKPEAANSVVKALRAVFRYGMLTDMVKRNPAADVEFVRRVGDGFHTWTAEEVTQFESRHPIGTKARLALALLLFTGQRRSDIVQLGPHNIGADGWLHFTQHKNRNSRPVTLALPVLPALREVIDATACGKNAFLVSALGTPYTAESFGNSFRDWCREADLPHCSAHGLRKAAASRLAEAGATHHEIAAVTGHRSLKEVQRYTVGATQRRMAATAFGRLSSFAAETEKSHLEGDPPEWDETDFQPSDNKGLGKCVVPRGGIEPPTLRFSVACSTN